MTKARPHFAGGASSRYLLLGAAVFLTLYGLVMIYSASFVTAAVKEGASWHFFVRQLAFIALGSAVAWFIARRDYRRLDSEALMIWGGGVVLLIATLIIGSVRNGAKRWIPLGLFNLQPSELAKLACIVFVASLAVQWSRGRLDTKTFLLRALIATGVPAALIMLQPDLGTTVTLVAAVAMVLILAGIDWRWVAASAAGAAVLGALMIVAEPYRIKRVLAFADPWADAQGKGYQIIQALLAFGTGGIDGVGLGLSRQKFFYLPEAHTDFILAIVGEEAGLIGTLALLGGIAVFTLAGFRIALGARDRFGMLVAGALSGTFALQSVLNMAAVTGMMPITGKPLPFVSYGGSSMIVTMMLLGLLLSVSRYGACAPRAVRPRKGSKESVVENHRERRGNSRPHPPRAERGRPARRRA